MQPMSQATLDLLKSRSMIGPNKPAHRVTIGGGDAEWLGTGKVIRGSTSGGDWYTGSTAQGGSFVRRDDGKILVTYTVGNDVILSVVNSEDDIFYADNQSAVGEWVFMTLTLAGHRASTLKRIANGNLLLFVLDSGALGTAAQTLTVYKSANGLGTDFTFLATVYTFDMTAYDTIMGNDLGEAYVGHPVQLDTGRILLPVTATKHWAGTHCRHAFYVAISDTNGASWTNVLIYDTTYPQAPMSGIGKFGTQLVASCHQYHGFGSMHFKISNDNGETWTSLDTYTAEYTGAGLHDQLCWGQDGYTYWLHSNPGGGGGNAFLVYRRPDTDTLPTTGQEPYDMENTWEGPLNPAKYGDDGWETLWVTDDGHIALAGTSRYVGGYTVSHIAGGIRSGKELPCKSIAISRTKGAASGLTVTADNKGGQYSPDGQTEWNQVLWPNAEITVEQGYGTDLVQTYKGTLDSVEMTTFPQEIRLSARDALKKALDQTVTGSTGNHVLIYTNSTVESIFISLCNFAGITYGTVEATGLTIARKEFAWESFADAMQWLAELVGFEIVADEQGLLHFRRDWYPDDGTSVYTFREGEDIISLGYTIDDRDLYNQVICHGRDADGNVIELVTNVPGADYWRLPANKIMKIDASDASTLEELNVIAARAIYLMMSKFRVVSFKAIGVPHIQVGDLITVIESSSTISEVYRVTDLSTNMDSNGYTMDITCHWYSHG